MSFFQVSPEHQQQFEREGYVLARQLFRPAEIERLCQYARADRAIAAQATSRSDAQGGTTTLSLSNDLGDNLYAAVVQQQRVAGNMARLLGDEVYHYHHKMMLKDPYIGGAWEWHQDYGYWYDFGCLYPTMASCFIAVDPATRENGCLQVIPGSHQGKPRYPFKPGGSFEVDPACIDPQKIVSVPLKAGEMIFFDAYLLHYSDLNYSQTSRRAIIYTYNPARLGKINEDRFHPIGE